MELKFKLSVLSDCGYEQLCSQLRNCTEKYKNLYICSIAKSSPTLRPNIVTVDIG